MIASPPGCKSTYVVTSEGANQPNYRRVRVTRTVNLSVDDNPAVVPGLMLCDLFQGEFTEINEILFRALDLNLTCNRSAAR